LLELSGIVVAVHPLVLAKSFWLSFDVLPSIVVSICKEISAVSVSEALGPLSFIAVTIKPHMDSIAFSFTGVPLPDIAVAMDALPDTIATLLAFVPLAIIDFAIDPDIGSFAMRFALGVLSLVSVTVGEQLIATAMPLVSLPCALIDPSSIIDYHSFALSFPFFVDFTSIYAVLILLNGKLGRLFPQLIIVKLFRDHLVEFNGLRLVVHDLLELDIFFHIFQLLQTEGLHLHRVWQLHLLVHL
jgi:hypothetical protein